MRLGTSWALLLALLVVSVAQPAAPPSDGGASPEAEPSSGDGGASPIEPSPEAEPSSSDGGTSPIEPLPEPEPSPDTPMSPCSPCGCYADRLPPHYPNSTIPMLWQGDDAINEREGCYDAAGSDDHGWRLELRANCTFAENEACNAGYCQLQGYDAYLPAYAFDLPDGGCVVWHAGTLPAAGRYPVLLGPPCSCEHAPTPTSEPSSEHRWNSTEDSPPSAPLPTTPPSQPPPGTPPSAPPFPPLGYQATMGVQMSEAAAAGKTASEVASALLSAMAVTAESAHVVIEKKSTLALALPEGHDARSPVHVPSPRTLHLHPHHHHHPVPCTLYPVPAPSPTTDHPREPLTLPLTSCPSRRAAPSPPCTMYPVPCT